MSQPQLSAVGLAEGEKRRDSLDYREDDPLGLGTPFPRSNRHANRSLPSSLLYFVLCVVRSALLIASTIHTLNNDQPVFGQVDEHTLGNNC